MSISDLNAQLILHTTSDFMVILRRIVHVTAHKSLRVNPTARTIPYHACSALASSMMMERGKGKGGRGGTSESKSSLERRKLG